MCSYNGHVSLYTHTMKYILWFILIIILEKVVRKAKRTTIIHVNVHLCARTHILCIHLYRWHATGKLVSNPVTPSAIRFDNMLYILNIYIFLFRSLPNPNAGREQNMHTLCWADILYIYTIIIYVNKWSNMRQYIYYIYYRYYYYYSWYTANDELFWCFNHLWTCVCARPHFVCSINCSI